MTPLAVTYRPTASLIPFARNSRTHDDAQIAQLVASIREFGFTNPILVDPDGGIIAGHGRVQAAQALGLEDVPTIELAGLTEAQKRAYVIADNKLALNAGWDDELLLAELKDLADAGYDLDLTGFAADEIIALEDECRKVEGRTDPDAVPPVQSDPITKLGDVWVLGRHRVICGDCRVRGDVDRVLAGAAINLAFTSPPYASQREYDTASQFRPIPPDEFVAWYADVAANIHAHLADDGSYFCNIKPSCDNGERLLYVMDLVLAHRRQWGWMFVDEFCWRNTKNGVPGGWENRFKNAFEPVFHFAKRAKIKFHALANASLSEDAFDYSAAYAKASTGSGLISGAKNRKDGLARPSNVVEVAASGEADHSAAFPVDLPAWFIRAFSDADDAVFDPFLGSGSTLIAAEKQGRRAVGVEISALYVDVIIRRWQNFTGKQATRESDGRSFDSVESVELEAA